MSNVDWFLKINFMNVFTQNTMQAPFTEGDMLIMNLRVSLDRHILWGKYQVEYKCTCERTNI